MEIETVTCENARSEMNEGEPPEASECLEHTGVRI